PWTFSRRQTAWSGTPFLKVVHIIRPRAALVNRFREILRTVLQGFYTAAPFENPHAFLWAEKSVRIQANIRENAAWFRRILCNRAVLRIREAKRNSQDSAVCGFAGAVPGAAPAHFSWKNSISSPTGPWQNAMRA